MSTDRTVGAELLLRVLCQPLFQLPLYHTRLLREQADEPSFLTCLQKGCTDRFKSKTLLVCGHAMLFLLRCVGQCLISVKIFFCAHSTLSPFAVVQIDCKQPDVYL